MKKKTGLIRIKPETKKFRDIILKRLKTKEMSAYEIAKVLSSGENLGMKEWRRFYFKVVHNCRKMEAEDILFSKEDTSGGGSIPKRVYRRRGK